MSITELPIVAIDREQHGIAIVCIALCAGAHAATGGTQVGWVLADQPDATAAYTPGADYSYNSTGGEITVIPYGTGQYSVTFSGIITNYSNAQINAYNSSSYCIDQGSGAGPSILCYDASGNPANTKFLLLFQRRFGTAGTTNHALAFVWAFSKTSTPTDNTYNSTGGTNTITRNGVGSYAAFFPGLPKTGGTVLATAYYSHYLQPARCPVKDWSTTASGTSVDLLCVDKTGAPFDNEVMLTYAIGQTFGVYALGSTRGAYGLASSPESTKPYSMPAAYGYNGFGTGALKSQKTGTGTYSVSIPGTISYSKSVALATAAGASSNYCNVAGWTQQTINVACFAQGGTPADSQFAVTFQTAP